MQTPWQPPETVDEFRLLRPLGSGGQGRVFVARDTLLDRDVAVKFLWTRDPEARSRERFLAEARAVARLRHPGIVGVHRVGDAHGQPFVVYELVDGQSLDRVARPLPPERVLDIGLQAARALAAAHREGLLHRDLKPSNLILTPAGEVKLLDFGLAQRADTSATAPPGSVEGSPLYLAPEVAAGELASFRSDVYALGLVLLELATSAPPMRPLQPLAVLGPAFEPGLAAVIARCLDDDPARRYASSDLLCDALEALSSKRAVLVIPRGNPYPGLRPFEAEHRSLFFGRGEEAAAILGRLRAQPFVLLVGESGAGKSSLCRAALLPAVREGAFGDQRTYEAVTVVPGRSPVAALAAALARALGLSEPTLGATLEADPSTLGRQLRLRLGAHKGLVVFVDQLEELCTSAEPSQALAAAEALASLCQSLPGLRLLATVRGDFLSRVAALPALGLEVPAALYLLRPLSREQLREAIVGPAARVGASFESEALVELLVDAAASAKGGLPLLQFTLAELWASRDREREVLTAAALDALGGVAGALASHADATLCTLSPEGREVARRLLCQLVHADGTRARRTESDLGLASSESLAVAKTLVGARLLVATELEGEPAYELAHEALVGGWSTLRGWLDAGAEDRARRQRIADAASSWERLGRSKEALWRERLLATIVAVDPAELPEREAAFVRASRAMVRRRRRLRAAAFVGVALVVAGSYGGVRLQARLERDEAIASRVEPARASLGRGRELARKGAETRARAYARFDAEGRDEERQEAERIYGEALDFERRADDALFRATQTLEAALLLDASRSDVRALLAEATLERVLLAERAFKDPRELTLRLATYDPEGRWRARLDAPAEVRLRVEPADARLTLAAYARVGPRRVLGDARDLSESGAKPTGAGAWTLRLGPGSYLLRASAPGRAEVRSPMRVERGEVREVRLQLPDARALPPGFVPIPRGRFLFGSGDPEGLRRFLGAPPQHGIETGPYLIAATEVTFADYLAFLRALRPDARARHTPTAAAVIRGSVDLRAGADGRYELTFQPAGRVYRAREGEPIRYEGRDRRAVQDWRRFPISALSWQDASAYLEWLDRSGRVPGARLCTEHEWERAARGADERVYPHGDRLAPDDANHDATYGRRPEAYGPDEVGAHPASDSPFGVKDLVGNVWEWTRSSRKAGEAVVRGGSHYQEEFTNRSNNRDVGEAGTLRDSLVGLRVCAPWPAAGPR